MFLVYPVFIICDSVPKRNLQVLLMFKVWLYKSSMMDKVLYLSKKVTGCFFTTKYKYTVAKKSNRGKHGME